jgi:hypothetical protein
MSDSSDKLIERMYNVSEYLQNTKGFASYVPASLVMIVMPLSGLFAVSRAGLLTGDFTNDFTLAAQAGLALSVGALSQSFGLSSMLKRDSRFHDEAIRKKRYSGCIKDGLKFSVIGGVGMTLLMSGFSYAESNDKAAIPLSTPSISIAK